MDVSSQFQHTTSIFSPDSQFVLSASGERLVLRIASTLQLHRTWSCPLERSEGSASCSLDFSPCSRRLLACFDAVRTIFAFAIDSEEEVARISAGIEGCRGAKWISETHIAIWSEHGLRITIWSLATGAFTVIKWPAHGPDRGWSLRSTDRRFLAVAEKHDGRDMVGIYDGQQEWKLVRQFAAATHDLRGLLWSPCGRYLAIWDDPLEYALYIYSPDGRRVCSSLSEGSATSSLGVRSVAWHPSGTFLAIAGFDGRVHVLNDLNWSSVATWAPSNRVSAKGTSLYQEPQDWIARTHGKGIIPFESLPVPRTLATTHGNVPLVKAQMGISHVRWSPSGTLLACVSAAMPALIHVFAFAGASQTVSPRSQAAIVIALHEPVTSVEWQPLIEREMLVVASGAAGICLWNANDSNIAEGMGVPATSSFAVKSVAWSRDGTQLLLSHDKSSFAVAYPVYE